MSATEAETYIGSRRPISSQERSSAYLDRIVREQNQFIDESDLKKFRERSRATGLIDAFASSPIFSEVYALASNRVDRFTDYKEYGHWLSGHLFSNLAWLTLSSNAPLDTIVIREDGVLDLLKEAGDIKLTRNQLGAESADGVYVPDGVLIGKNGDKDNVLSIYEYTLSLEFEKFARQFTGFRFTKGRFNGTCANDVNLVFVVPSTSADILEQLRRNLLTVKRENEQVPLIVPLNVSRADFGIFVNYVLRDYNDGALQKEMLERHHLINGICISRDQKRQELRRRAERLFQSGDPEDLGYVLNYGPQYERQFNGFRRGGIITLPRRSQASLSDQSHACFIKQLDIVES